MDAILKALSAIGGFINPGNNTSPTNVTGSLFTVGLIIAAVIELLTNIEGVLCKFGVASACLKQITG